MTEISELNDEDLIWHAQQGGFSSFMVLYERYFPFVYRRVKYSVPLADVEDVTQEVFIAVIRSLKDFRGDCKFKTWLYSITNRKIADFYRRRDPADLYLQRGDDDDKEKDETFVDAGNSFMIDEKITVRQALTQLPHKYQEVLLLRFADDLPFLDIAHEQGQTLEATKSLFRRAITMLRKVLEEAHV